jgi:transposase
MIQRRYTPEFKRAAVALLAEKNYTLQQAADCLGVKKDTLKGWVKEHRRRHGALNATEETDLRKRLKELERENQRLTLERDILKKAAAYFAKEQL